MTASALQSHTAGAVHRPRPHPDDIYRADDPGGAWTALPRSQQGQPYTIYSSTDKLGYFAAVYSSSATPPPGGVVTIGGGQTLPIIVAVLIVVVVLAGLPLALMRRRRSAEGTEDDSEERS